jgi:hypothetical protein
MTLVEVDLGQREGGPAVLGHRPHERRGGPRHGVVVDLPGLAEADEHPGAVAVGQGQHGADRAAEAGALGRGLLHAGHLGESVGEGELPHRRGPRRHGGRHLDCERF